MGGNDNQEKYEAALEEEREFHVSLEDHIKKNYINGTLTTLTDRLPRTYLMIVPVITRLDVLSLGQFHVSVEKIEAVGAHKVGLTLKRL